MPVERPHHTQYLSDFRTKQCQLFLERKCPHHRPFSCFNWHFDNQRRRLPYAHAPRSGSSSSATTSVQASNPSANGCSGDANPTANAAGAPLFAYSPHLYCPKYETAGTCPDADACPLLHKCVGDSERRFHPRFYKTVVCPHATDPQGHCTRNGVHCPYAHGATDLRSPTLDRDEVRVALIERDMLRLVSSTASASSCAAASAQAQHQHPPAGDPAPASARQQQQSAALSKLAQSYASVSTNTNGSVAPAPPPPVNGVLGLGINGVAGVGLCGPQENSAGGLLAVAVARSAELVQRLAYLRAQLDHDFRRLVGPRSAALFDRADEHMAPQLQQQQQHAPLGHLEDTLWNDMGYVLEKYKTTICPRPPRQCRQGFACPFFHNNAKDRRRSPAISKYKSSACPAVKRGDEWGDPSVCEAGDSCPMCHTRSEQQFHPEIYKSTKCNDMLTCGYCPRGPFCAFSHLPNDAELARQSALIDERRDSTSSLHQLNGAPLSPGAGSNARCAPGIAPSGALVDRHIGTWNPSPPAVQPSNKAAFVGGEPRDAVTRTNGEQQLHQHFTFVSGSSYAPENDSGGLCVSAATAAAGVACARERSTLGAIDEEQSQSGLGGGLGIGADTLLGVGRGPSASESGFVGSPPFAAAHHQQASAAAEQQDSARLALGRMRYSSGPAAFSHAINTQLSYPPVAAAGGHLAPTNAYPPADLPTALIEQLFPRRMSYDESQQQQQQHELVARTTISPALSSVFGSSSLGTLGSSAAFSPNAFSPPVVQPGAVTGPLCIGEGATGPPMSATPLMHSQQQQQQQQQQHQQQHSPSTLQRLEQLQMLQQAQAATRMQLQLQQQQQQVAMGAAGFGAIGAERVRRDSHSMSSSGASFGLLASAEAPAVGLDSSFSQLLNLDPATGLCHGAGMAAADAQVCYNTGLPDMSSCFAPAVGDALQMPAAAAGSCGGSCVGMHAGAALPNGLGLSEAAALRLASKHWSTGESCSSNPRSPSGQYF